MRRLKKRITRFLQLSWAERLLLLRAAIVLASVRVALQGLPLKAVRRIASAVAFTPPKTSIQNLVWAVSAASRYLPGASCLPQAIALQAMLARSGFSSRVEIGIAREQLHRLEAHAWVTCVDQVVIGGPDVTRYTPLTVLEK